jgi:ATP-dependent Clp protease ATP-binding subunit ClpC
MLGGVFERFTATASHVVVKAQEQAHALGHDHIGTEHLLLGLACEQREIADQVLHSVGITPDRARDQLVLIVPPSEPVTSGEIPFTPLAKKALELSLRESLALSHTSIGTGHVLLGLLAAKDEISMQIVRECGVDPNAIPPAVLALLSGPDPHPPRLSSRVRGRRASGIGRAMPPPAAARTDDRPTSPPEPGTFLSWNWDAD